MEIVLSSDDPMKAKLYFGNTTHIYRYDGTPNITLVLSAKTNNTFGAWAVKHDILYYTTVLPDNDRSLGFYIQSLNLTDMSEYLPHKALKGVIPRDLKVVDSTRSGNIGNLGNLC